MNKKSSKLLAAVAVFAVVACAFAVVMPADDIDAVDSVVKDGSYELKDGIAIEGATFDSTTGTLTLDEGASFTQGFYYDGESLTVVVNGTNTITVDRGDATLVEKKYAAIYASGGVTIKPTKATGDKLVINMTGSYTNEDNVGDKEYSFAVYTSGADIQIGDATGNNVLEIDIDASVTDKYAMAVRAHNNSTINFDNVTGSIDGGNRAVYAKTISFENSTLTLTGGEKAMTAGSNGTITLGSANDTKASKITANLGDAMTNEAGQDDLFGVKTGTLTVYGGSTLTTKGAHVVSGITETGTDAIAGLITISGYAQNPDAKIPAKVAGLYYEGADAITVKNEAPTSGSAGVYLVESAEAFGNINMTSGDNKEVSVTADSTVVENVAEQFNDANKATTVNLVVGSGGLTNVTDPVVVPVGKELVLLAQGATNLTISIANAAGDDTTNKVTLTGYKGTLVISQGSTELSGLIEDGTVLAEGDIVLTGDIIINAGAVDGSDKLTITGNLSANGYKIKVVKGTLDLGGTAELKVNGSVEVVGTDATNSLIVGNITSGAVNLSGTSTIGGASAFTVGESAKLTVLKGANITAGAQTLHNDGAVSINGTVTGDVVNDGTITLVGTLAGTAAGDIVNNKTIILASEDAQLSNVTETGNIDTSAILKEGTWSGSYSSATYGIQQQITVTGPTEITAGSMIEFQGTLIINEGQTLTIVDGSQLVFKGSFAKLINNGTIIIESDVVANDASVDNPDQYKAPGTGTLTNFTYEGGLVIQGAIVENYGTIEAKAYDPKDTPVTVLNVNSGKIENYGSIVINEENVLKVGATLNNKSAGTIEIYGAVSGSTSINNEGIVNIDSESSVNATLTVNQLATTGVVNIVETGIIVEVTDSGMVMGKIDGVEKTVASADANKVNISSYTTDKCLAGGIVISSEAVKKKDAETEVEYFENRMIVSGTLVAEKTEVSTEETATVTVTITGPRVAVVDAFSISEGAIITGTSGTLLVEGEVSSNNATISVGTLTVTGSLTAVENDVDTTDINGAKYEVKATTSTKATYYYSGLKAAIEGASAASVTKVVATGDIVLNDDVTIPAGMTVEYDEEDTANALTIAAEKTLTVADTGKLNVKSPSDVIVKGTLYVTVKKTGINTGATITSDVMSEGEKDVRYTSLAAAIVAAGSSEVTIKLNGNATVSADLVIPANVTVDTNEKTFTVDKCKLTVDGVLYLNGGDFKVNQNDDATKGTVVLNGYIQKDVSMTFNNKEYPAGVQYEDDKYYYITSLANIGVAVENDADQNIYVYGGVSANDIAITGTADKPVAVYFKASAVTLGKDVNKISVGTITIDYATVSIDSTRTVTGTIAGANGSVKMVDVASDKVDFVASEDDDKVKTLTMAGGVTTISEKEKTYALVTEGTVILNKITTPENDEEVFGLVINGTTTVSGESTIPEVIVNGTMIVDNGAKVTTAGVAAVMGTLKVLEATTDGKSAGTYDVTQLYVGFAQSTGANAVVEGTVNVLVGDATNGYGFAAVVAGSQLSEKTLEGFEDYTAAEIDLDGVKYTVYLPSGSSATFADVFGDATVKDAFAKGWKDKDGNPVLSTGPIGVAGPYTADIIEDVYRVTITAVDGISNVTIDGQLMTKYDNTFIAIVAAGPHSIAYTLAGGYEGTAVLGAKNVTVSGMTFTTEGTPKALVSGDTNYPDGNSGEGFNYIEYELQLTGITVKDTSASTGGMGLTDILLIVLVVLIAIMAVVIAMRMMRS